MNSFERPETACQPASLGSLQLQLTSCQADLAVFLIILLCTHIPETSQSF